VPPPAPSSEPTFPPVPVILARVAWRDEGFTRVAWDGTSTTGWITGGTAVSGAVSSLSSTSSDSWRPSPSQSSRSA
ncbi:MAG: hypothetical protein ACO3Q5_08200, partial [Ilumatobacteraceae bacterium]